MIDDLKKMAKRTTFLEAFEISNKFPIKFITVL